MKEILLTDKFHTQSGAQEASYESTQYKDSKHIDRINKSNFRGMIRVFSTHTYFERRRSSYTTKFASKTAMFLPNDYFHPIEKHQQPHHTSPKSLP